MQRKQNVASISMELPPELWQGGTGVGPSLNHHRLAVPVSEDVNDNNILLFVVNMNLQADIKGNFLNGLL